MPRKDFLFSHSFRVRYSEIDGQKIVFNANYLTYFDTAIVEYFRWLPFDYHSYTDQSEFDFYTVKAQINFKSPIYFDEEIDVCVRIDEIKRTSIIFVLEIYKKGDNALLASGEIIWVHINKESVRPAKVSDRLLDIVKSRT